MENNRIKNNKFTILQGCSVKFEEKHSVVIGSIEPVATVKKAVEFIEKIKKDHPQATHNVYLYRIVEEGQEYVKFSDDGEPSGTAGKPMFEVASLSKVFNFSLVATRYFGGIKLGAGGLVRMYAKTAKLAFTEAKVIPFIKLVSYSISFPYSLDKIVKKLITSNNIIVQKKTYLQEINLDLCSSEEQRELFFKYQEIKFI